MTAKPLVTAVKQVCVVVEDLDATIRDYWKTAGIGPWAVWTPKLTATRVRGIETPFSMKLAMAWTEGFMWEVVQPLEGPSHYHEHLDRHGEGVHHVLVVTGNHAYEEMLAETAARGCPPLMEGNRNGVDFAYLDTVGPLKMVLEVFRRPENYRRPEPDYCYPHRPANMPL